ncbi:MAG: hypothetical protein K2Y27_15215, partial [Xanthobacteraceae bacterium]|nr:hypothetical protein [Xanthobacteraceae bacterium]
MRRGNSVIVSACVASRGLGPRRCGRSLRRKRRSISVRKLCEPCGWPVVSNSNYGDTLPIVEFALRKQHHRLGLRCI